MNARDEEQAEQMAAQMMEEFKKDMSPQQIAFLMSMAYDPEMHEEGSQQQQPEK